MIQAAEFLSATRKRGFGFFTGVPCSFLTPVINRVISDSQTAYVGAASEGEAVGIAAGAWLAGKQTVVLCQNSGLGNTVNPLTSLNWPFRIPTLLITTWRGQPGLKDEPQHELMGQITGQMLDTMKIPNAPFPEDSDGLASALEAARGEMENSGLPYAFVLAKGTVADEPLDETPLTPPPVGSYDDFAENAGRPGRGEVLEKVLEIVPDEAAIIATTGKCGRELFTLADRDQHLYQVGSMGCAGGMGLGVALNVSCPVVVLDGDGAALMKLGGLATIGAYGAENLVHVVLDNGVHDSTGGQATVSASVDFARIARACGYQKTFSCDTVAGFAKAFADAIAGGGPALIHIRIQPGSQDNLGRPTIGPAEVARRLRNFLEPHRKVRG